MAQVCQNCADAATGPPFSMSIDAPPTIPRGASVCLLQSLGVLGIRGPDAARFLQGQLSNDLALLVASAPGAATPPALLRAGLHNPQGRTLALLGLATAGPEAILALLPRELIAATLATLRRYVLRSKVALSDESEQWHLCGLMPAAGAADIGLAAGLCVSYDQTRRLLLLRVEDARPAGEPLPYAQWHALDIAAGLPQVYGASAGQFVAQMLNLDCIGAISFTKGCYTGQEVIARAHYRGRVKRRMQRYLSRTPLQLSPGEQAELAAGGLCRVVDSVQRADGRCEFLAVAALPGAAAETAEGGAATGKSASDTTRRLDAEALPLPYPLPE
jgi:folate-binding protein YgfZ